MKKSQLQQIIKEELQKVLKEGDPYRGIKSDINETWEDPKTIENDIYNFLEHSHESGGPELVKDIMNAISRALNKSNKFLKEARVDINDQGYGQSVYKISSDILDTWKTTETITSDLKGYMKAAHDTQGKIKPNATLGGPRLVKEVMNAILKSVNDSKPLLRKERGSDTDTGEDLA